MEGGAALTHAHHGWHPVMRTGLSAPGAQSSLLDGGLVALAGQAMQPGLSHDLRTRDLPGGTQGGPTAQLPADHCGLQGAPGVCARGAQLASASEQQDPVAAGDVKEDGQLLLGGRSCGRCRLRLKSTVRLCPQTRGVFPGAQEQALQRPEVLPWDKFKPVLSEVLTPPAALTISGPLGWPCWGPPAPAQRRPHPDACIFIMKVLQKEPQGICPNSGWIPGPWASEVASRPLSPNLKAATSTPRGQGGSESPPWRQTRTRPP